jgi:Raf kinase inhibitor-like YbhB/YbcL family protein
VIAPASCDANNHAGNQTNGGGTGMSATLTKLSLTSDAFENGGPIPAQYTCDGAGQSPALRWSDPPAGTKSFALVIEDPDAPSGTFRHWGLYDIPASARSIGRGQRIGNEVPNDFGKPGYGAPCPPKGHGLHHYHFRLFALAASRLNLGPNAKATDVKNAAQSQAIAEGELIGTYERK